MTIPKGSEYTFNVTVMEKDSFLPQDLTNIDLTTSTFKLVELAGLCDVTTGTATITIVDAANGLLSVTLDTTMTESLSYERGDKVDNYYLKPTYQGVIDIQFTDTTANRVAIVPEISVAPTGVVCA